jgi:hypothetical protein
MLPPANARPVRSTFISIIAWLGILSGAMGVIGSCAFLLVHASVAGFIGLASGAVALATALGLRRRREWARQALVAFLGYSTLMGFVEAVRFRLPQLSSFTAAGGVPPGVTQAQLDAMAASAHSTALTGAAVFGLLNVLIILKLCTRRVRAEFPEDLE